MNIPLKKHMQTDLSVTIAVVISIFVLYLFSVPHTVVLEDDGLFLMAAWFNGIAHPPGYPLYTLLSHIATWIPIGSIAYRVHLLSAVFAALGCGTLYLVIRKLGVIRFPACIAAIAFGMSPVFWSQAIIAEVYSLNLLILLILVLLSLSYVEQDEKSSCKTMAWMGLFLGAGLANHWPLILISLPMLLIVLQETGTRPLKQAGYFLPFFIMGLLPYAWLVLRSQADPEISFYGPLNTLSDIWFFISREGFRQVDQSFSADMVDKFQFIGFTLSQSARQFGVIGAILILIGLVYQSQLLPRRIVIALLIGFLSHTLGLILLLKFDYDYLHQSIFRVYPIIAYSILSIWLAVGLSWIVTRLGDTKFRDRRLRVVIALLVLASTATSSIPENLRSNETAIESYAKVVLDTLSPESILFLDDDFTVLPIGYINKVKKYRNDVEIYQSSGLIFS
ncbi:MAG: DUF2723 domain-containing protein, partial [Gammaproteobacteria bacterium]|nr:DUF2723 domain-containing protein [Gammaproteobacteria bacterium]